MTENLNSGELDKSSPRSQIDNHDTSCDYDLHRNPLLTTEQAGFMRKRDLNF